jgi:hypothetical protein
VRKLLTLSAIALFLIAAVMIVAPRLWVKNKTAHFVRDGKVVTGYQLYFGSHGRMLLVPNAGDTAYAYLPRMRPHATAKCRKPDFRYVKRLAFGTDSNCEMLHTDQWAVEGVKWKFSVPAGPEFEVHWDTEFRR